MPFVIEFLVSPAFLIHTPTRIGRRPGESAKGGLAVYHRVDFGCAAAAACAQGLVLAPFFPRAERWTLMAVLSIALS
jgi:hypothetical protein